MQVYVDITTNQVKVEVGGTVKMSEAISEDQAKRLILHLVKALQDIAVAKHAL